MDADRVELTREKSEDRNQDNSLGDDLVEDDKENLQESSKYRSKDRRKSRREEKDGRNRDKDRLKTGDDSKDRDRDAKDSTGERIPSREKRKDDKHRDKDHDRDRDKRDREKDREHDREGSHKDIERGQEKERGKEKHRDRDKEREHDREGLHKDIERGQEKERGKEKHRDRDKQREKDREEEKARDRHRAKDREKEKEKSRGREKEREYARDDKEKGKGRDRDSEVDRGAAKPSSRKGRDDGYDRKDKSLAEASSSEEEDGMIIEKKGDADTNSERPNQSTTELEERILRMREDRTKNKSEGASEILSWVSKSRVIEEKLKAEKVKALQRSKIFEEQDHADEEESDDGAVDNHFSDGLGGAKVLHGLDKVMEGGSVVLTLKDQSILANGDVNEDVDMLENVEIGEQKRRDNAYKAAKKKTGVYDDKFNDEPGSERKMLPQYDEEVDEGVSLDAIGRFTGEAEKKLEELRNRLKGGSSASSFVENLATSVKIASDYYTQEEMTKFKKPKKKKSLRKKDKLDLNALEAEAISSGLGASDLGSRNDAKRRATKEEQERSESEKRSSAYQAAFVKADEASRALRISQTHVQDKDVDTPFFADDAEDLQKSLERTRKLSLKKQNEAAASGIEAIARLASKSSRHLDDNVDARQPSESNVVITEMEEFVQGLQLDEEADKLRTEDVFMEEDEVPETPKEEIVVDVNGQKDSKDPEKGKEDISNDEVVLDEIIHEVPVGKGIAGALRLLKERGDLKETVEWGGRNMDKKKSKLVGIYDEHAQKEIRIERTDEYGRILTPKEAFRQLSHKFHGKGPGKMKQEKRLRQWEDEMKLKKMKNADTPSQSVERMREALAQAKTPHIILSGNVKTGQNGDPTGGFSTVGKDLPGGLTPMLGDKKVEHFLGIKRKVGAAAESGIPKKPKT